MGRYVVRSSVDAFAARRGVRVHAITIGFSKIESEELAVVASELCTNIVKYGVRGELAVSSLDDPRNGAGIVLDAFDVGPPFHDFSKAIRDGSDDRKTIPPDAIYVRSGIGAGLGAVERMTHFLWTEPAPGGKRVLAVRYLKPPGSRSSRA